MIAYLVICGFVDINNIVHFLTILLEKPLKIEIYVSILNKNFFSNYHGFLKMLIPCKTKRHCSYPHLLLHYISIFRAALCKNIILKYLHLVDSSRRETKLWANLHSHPPQLRHLAQGNFDSTTLRF